MTLRDLVIQCESSGVMILLDGNEITLRGKSKVVRHAKKQLRPYKARLVTFLRDRAENEAKYALSLLLERFRFDLIGKDIAPEELTRVNNLCYRLVSAHKWDFDEAMTAAARWVVDNAPHDDELVFADVLRLWKAR